MAFETCDACHREADPLRCCRYDSEGSEVSYDDESEEEEEEAPGTHQMPPTAPESSTHIHIQLLRPRSER